MLETVKALLREACDNASNNCFESFYNNYLMQVQDSNLVSEIHYNIHRSNSSILAIERLAHDQHERLVKLH